MKKTLITAFTLLTIPAATQAGSIHGVVSDESGALPDADVLLYSQRDTTKVINTDMTTTDGKFIFNNLPEGHYMVKVEFIGYKTKKINVSLTKTKPDIKAMKVNMKNDEELLQGVEIVGQRTALHVDADKKTFLVNAGAVVEGVSVSDLLREVPSVDVDMEGNVSLRSNENVEIYINGKPAGLGDGNSAEILEQLPANSIEKVEVITNPSSKFNAEGGAGIINIVLKEDFRKGYYGSVTGGLNVPINGHIMGNVGASISYTANKWTLTGAAGWQGWDNEGEIDRDRKNYNFKKGDTTFTKSHADTRRKMNSEFLRLGATYRMDEKNSFSWNGMASLAQRDFSNDYLYSYGSFSDKTAIANRHSTNYSTTDGNRTVLNTSLDYTHKFEREGESLQLAASANKNTNKNDNFYSRTELDSLRKALNSSRSYETENRNMYANEYTAQADYTLPFGKSSKVEMGVKANWRNDQTKSDTLQFFNTNEDKLIEGKNNSKLYNANHKSSTQNNDFEMQQNVYAAYVTYSNTLGKRLKYNLGLRGELTDMNWEQNTTGDKSSKDPYFDLFPSAFLSYTLSETDELQLNYTRRVSRPRMRFINPYVNENDSLNIQYGNPDLDPEMTHSVELNYVKNIEGDLYTASVYYKLTNDVISRYSWIDNQVSNTTFGNISKSQEEGVELIAKNHIGFLTLTSNLNVYYYQLEGGNFNINVVSKENGQISRQNVYLDEQSSFSWTGKLSADMKLPWDLTGQITANYSSPKAISQGRRHHIFTSNAGLKRSFMNRKLTTALSVRDMFNSFKFKTRSYDFNFDQENSFRRGGTTFYLNVSYNFGNMGTNKKKPGSNQNNEDVEEFSDFGGE